MECSGLGGDKTLLGESFALDVSQPLVTPERLELVTSLCGFEEWRFRVRSTHAPEGEYSN